MNGLRHLYNDASVLFKGLKFTPEATARIARSAGVDSGVLGSIAPEKLPEIFKRANENDTSCRLDLLISATSVVGAGLASVFAPIVTLPLLAVRATSLLTASWSVVVRRML